MIHTFVIDAQDPCLKFYANKSNPIEPCHILHSDHLNQGFSPGLPRHTRVSQGSAHGAVSHHFSMNFRTF
jgi:hypothetical protein